MNQPGGGAHRTDNRAADQAARDGAAEQSRQPGTHAEKQLDEDRLLAVFQVDQQRISTLDTIMMTIRGWTVTLVSAIVGFSLSQHHRSLLPVAMVGTVLFGMLDIGYRRTQLLHASRADEVEKVIVPKEYRLRPGPRSPHLLGAGHIKRFRRSSVVHSQDRDESRLARLTLHRSRYQSSISFYVVVLLLLLLLLILT
jgi:hypothetical protein